MTTALAVKNDQDYWSDSELAMLSVFGLAETPKSELQVFFHYCKKVHLDPFTREIYLIGRNQKQGNDWVKRYTIQAGIDGLRKIASRSGNYGGQETVWCGKDGVWRDVWLQKEPPLAAKVSVFYKDSAHSITAVAKFDSYAVYFKEELAGLWKKMPDTMIAKCAEALALRKAFPQDLSGIYSTEEMEQSDSVPVVEAPRLSAVRDEQPAKNWSANTTIGRTIANTAPRDEMPTETSPILDVADAVVVDDWGIKMVRVEGWDDTPFVTEVEQSNPDAECEHGNRTWRTAKDNSWGAWFCPTPKGTQGQCQPIWYDLKDGEWVK